MFWTCLPTVVCTANSNGEFYKRRCCGSEQRGTAALRTKSGVQARDDEQWKTNLDQITIDVMHVRKPPEHFCAETSWRDNNLRSLLRPHHFSKRDSEFDI